MNREGWVQECLSTFISEYKCEVFKFSECDLKGLDEKKISERKQRFGSCNFVRAFALYLVKNSLQNIVLYHGYVSTKSNADPDNLHYCHQYCILVALPSKDICILGIGALGLRQTQRFKTLMNDNMRTTVLLRYKRFVLFEDIDFSDII